ncbi:MAG: dihydrodipicolinate synthase family protein [bacterium]
MAEIRLFPPKGVYAASLTPMKKDLSVDHDRLAAHCRWLLQNGCDGLVILGTTGEANSLSVTERIDLIETLVESGLPAHRLIVGTGCCAVPDTQTLTEHALRCGVGGVLILPPFYYKRVTDDGLFAVFDKVIQHAGNSRLKIYLYHFPQMSGIPFSDTLIERFLSVYPGTIAGIKDSSGDWNHMKTLCQTFPDFEVFAGTEKFLLDILKAGGVGCISATANVTCRLIGEIYAKWKTEDVHALQERLTRIRQAFESYSFVPALKVLMADWTDDPSWENMRPPHVPLKEEEAEALKTALKNLDFQPEIRTHVP